MTFEEWWNTKDYPASCKGNCMEAFKAGEEKVKEEIAELKKRNGELAGQKASLERWLGEAKDLIRNLLRVTYGEGWNYSLDWKVQAEKFLKEEL